MDLMSRPARYNLLPMYRAHFSGFTHQGEMLSSTGRRYRDVISSSPGDLDGSSDVSGRGSMDMMSRPASCNPKLV
eukprot:6806975-Prymnesium_polylepis.1